MMLPVDFVKALGLAILIMAADLCVAYLFVTAWVLIHHHPLAMTDPETVALSTQSTRIFGPILMALGIWVFSRRRPDRNRWAFALSVFGFYLLVDWGMVAFRGILEPAVLAIALLKLLGALAGAWLARWPRRA